MAFPHPDVLGSASGRMRRGVVVTGLGMVTGMGIGRKANAAGFREGRTAFRDVMLFDTSRRRAKRAAEANLPDELPATRLPARSQSRLDRASRMLVLAAAEALESAGLAGEQQVEAPIVLGTSAGAMELGEAFYRAAVTSDGRRVHGQAVRAAGYQTQVQAVALGRAFGVRGPALVITNACASGANAIGHAFRLVQRGRADIAIAGGHDALSELVFAGFDALQALSPTLPRPFDRDRDGLGLGEGAAIMVIESAESAACRGAAAIAQILGYGSATDVHHLTQPHPEGLAAVASMTAACAEAGVAPREIDYINSHGTGTPLNDIAEAKAIAAWAGNDAPAVSVSSTKGGIGHLLGGAGAVEAGICLLAIEGGWLPPTASLRNADPACTFDLVAAPRDKTIRRALTNSFGFGGANATLVLGAPA